MDTEKQKKEGTKKYPPKMPQAGLDVFRWADFDINGGMTCHI